MAFRNEEQKIFGPYSRAARLAGNMIYHRRVKGLPFCDFFVCADRNGCTNKGFKCGIEGRDTQAAQSGYFSFFCIGGFLY